VKAGTLGLDGGSAAGHGDEARCSCPDVERPGIQIASIHACAETECQESDMPKLHRSLIIALALAGAASLAQAQTAPSSAPRAATAPGVTRAVEHPDTDTTVDQTQPDAHQPETASDPKSSGPETARDDTKLKPETATDAPKLSATQQAAEKAKQGVRSNTPPSK
jgi:hypothetical protein